MTRKQSINQHCECKICEIVQKPMVQRTDDTFELSRRKIRRPQNSEFYFVKLSNILHFQIPIFQFATKRGQELEGEVFELLKNGNYPLIEKCGIILRADMPAFGSSPDGIDNDYIFEIKCPSKKKTVKDYIANGVPSKKVFLQMQLQMLMSGRSKGILAIADPEFEKNRQFIECEVHLDKNELSVVIDKCKSFWKETIFLLSAFLLG